MPALTKLYAVLAMTLGLLAPVMAQAFDAPTVVSSSIENVQRHKEYGIAMDLRILLKNDNHYPITVRRGVAGLGLQGYKVGDMAVLKGGRLPAFGMQEIVLRLKGDKRQRAYISQTVRSQAVVDYALKGMLIVDEWLEPVEIKQVSRFRVPKSVQR